VRAHAVEIHPGVTKIVVMALGATGRWVARERRMVGEERGERREDLFYAYNIEWESTVFPYALGNTVETQWTKLNVGLLLWDIFMVFFLFFLK
jgi:hypothetical protein